jgi:Domain of unknown function DUF29
MASPQNAPGYEEDFVAWLEDQARRARRGDTEGLDLDNIAEELEGMARSDRREIRSRLTVLLVHLLKCSVPPKARRSAANQMRSPVSAFRSAARSSPKRCSTRTGCRSDLKKEGGSCMR